MPGIASDAPVQKWTNGRLFPVYGKGKKRNYNLGPSLALKFGTTVALAGATSNTAWTIDFTGSPTGGTFAISLAPWGSTLTTGPIIYNAAAAGTETGLGTTASPWVSVQGALLGLLGAGQATVTGSAQPGNVQTITFTGTLAGMPVPSLAVVTGLLTGGTAACTVTNTVVGQTAGQATTYSTALLTAPAVAPTLTAASGTLAAAQITVGYTYVNALGETTLSPTATIAADGSHKITISSIAIPTGATGINYYVSDGGELFYLTQLTTAAAQDVTTTTLTAGNPQKFPPDSNTTAVALGFLEFDSATDSAGNVTLGGQSGGDPNGYSQPYAPVFISGEFNAADLTGLDFNALKQLKGRQTSGAVAATNTTGITSGIVLIPD